MLKTELHGTTTAEIVSRPFIVGLAATHEYDMSLMNGYHFSYITIEIV